MRGSLALQPDARALHVGNSQTDDVTVVYTATGAVLGSDKLEAAARPFSKVVDVEIDWGRTGAP